VAIAHKILVAIYHMLSQQVSYNDLGDLYLDKLNQHHLTRNLVHRLERLGYTVTLTPERAWQRSELTDVTAKVAIYEAFVEGKLEPPKHLARSVHDLYFEPKYEEFRPRTIWSVSNAFTSAFKELDPIPQFRATAKLGEFLEARFSQSF